MSRSGHCRPDHVGPSKKARFCFFAFFTLSNQNYRTFCCFFYLNKDWFRFLFLQNFLLYFVENNLFWLTLPAPSTLHTTPVDPAWGPSIVAHLKQLSVQYSIWGLYCMSYGLLICYSPRWVMAPPSGLMGDSFFSPFITWQGWEGGGGGGTLGLSAWTSCPEEPWDSF